jgi:hypothetical protein
MTSAILLRVQIQNLADGIHRITGNYTTIQTNNIVETEKSPLKFTISKNSPNIIKYITLEEHLNNTFNNASIIRQRHTYHLDSISICTNISPNSENSV